MGETFVQVVFPISLRQTFTYRVPPVLAPLALPGCRVWASFGRRQAVGLVVETADRPPRDGLRLKAIDAVLDDKPALIPELMKLGRWIADYYYCSLGEALFAALPGGLSKDPKAVLELSEMADEPSVKGLLSRWTLRGVNFESLRSGRVPYTSRTKVLAEALREKGWGGVRVREELPDFPLSAALVEGFGKPLTLNPDQEAAYGVLQASIEHGTFGTFLLEGVTGSGKTEVYLRAIQRTLEIGKQALILIPEIALTPQTVSRFRERLGNRVAVLHSRLGPAERAAEWRKVAGGFSPVAVGARSALFAPLERLGLIVVDEEHEPSYKQEDAPRYQARDAALMRARWCGATVILGSATPSLESLHNARTGKYTHLKLPRRAKGTPPQVKVVDLREEWRSRGGDRPVLSLPLKEALEKTLSSGGQTMLFLNRRGFHPITLCEKCAEPSHCPSCAVPLTFHRQYGPGRAPAWVCHYCLRVLGSPPKCASCGAVGTVQTGLGTERVEEEVHRLFPKARLERMDMDTTAKAGSLEAILKRFGQGTIDILVGTQMIAKGHDFPGVTLVGVVGADVGLALPDFRSAERVHQLLVQVSGRAGRAEKAGTVYIQTFHPEHPCVESAVKDEGDRFVAAELELRRELQLPPFHRLGLVTYRAIAEAKARSAAESAALLLAKQPGIEVRGPYPAPFFKLRGQHRYHILLKSAQPPPIRAALKALDSKQTIPTGVMRVVDLDPQSML